MSKKKRKSKANNSKKNISAVKGFETVETCVTTENATDMSDIIDENQGSESLESEDVVITQIKKENKENATAVEEAVNAGEESATTVEEAVNAGEESATAVEEAVNADEEELPDTQKKKKSKKRLGLIFIKEDLQTGLEKKLIEPNKVQKISELLIALLVAVAMIAVMFGIRYITLEHTVKKLQNEMTDALEEKDEEILKLQREKDELEEKVGLLSNQVVVKMVEDEESEAKRMPSGLPVNGKTEIIAEPRENIENPVLDPNVMDTVTDENGEVVKKEPIVIFGVDDGSKIMASGNGTVVLSGYDDEYTFRVEIDHGNGYVSIYRFPGEPKVQENDEVLRGQLLFEATGNDGLLGYQIKKDGEFIDPMTEIEING